MSQRIELVYVTGCPNVTAARENLRQALAMTGRPAAWVEWVQSDPEAPLHVRRFGSPTVLVDGRDVTGMEPAAAGAACRASGAPSIDEIRAALPAE